MNGQDTYTYTKDNKLICAMCGTGGVLPHILGLFYDLSFFGFIFYQAIS